MRQWVLYVHERSRFPWTNWRSSCKCFASFPCEKRDAFLFLLRSRRNPRILGPNLRGSISRSSRDSPWHGRCD